MPKTKKPIGEKSTLKPEQEKEDEITKATIFLSSPYNASYLVQALLDTTGEVLENKEVFAELTKKNKQAAKGNLEELEKILLNQASVLDAVFYNYISRSTTSKYLEHAQAFGEMAFKAQKQCRTTIATLAELKKPRSATFIRQQNNANNQQINNTTHKNQSKKSKKIINLKNELLEANHDTMDNRTQAASISSHSQMETVGKINRCEN